MEVQDLNKIKKITKIIGWVLVLLFIASALSVSALANDGGSGPETDEVETEDETEDGDSGNETDELDEDDEDSENGDDDDEDDDEDGDDVDDDEEDEEERSVSIDIEDDEVEIESRLKNGAQKDEFDVEFSVDEGVEIELEYEHEIEDDEIEIENESEFEIEFKKLIEFRDLNNDGLFDEDNDETVSTYDLRDQEYSDINYTTTTTPDGETEHIISVYTVDGIFGLKLYLVENFAIIENGTLTPTEVKIDIFITDYNYLGNDTQLALKIEIETESKIEYDDDSHDEDEGYAENEEELEITNSAFEGFFSWSNVSTVDGKIEPVKSSELNQEVDDGEVEYDLYFIYARGDTIVHDPKIGVIRDQDSNENDQDAFNVTSGIGIISMIAIISLVAIYFRKRKL
jgi:hypothetical protein